MKLAIVGTKVALVVPLLLLAALAVSPLLAQSQQHTTVEPVGKRSCIDIESVDFTNITFESAGTKFKFQNGKANHWDCPECGIDRDRPDWQATIERDKVMSPSPNVKVRFLLVHDVHVTGIGWSYHVVGFRCAPVASGSDQKRLLRVFDWEDMSLRLEQLNDRGITVAITVAQGQPKSEHFAYAWDSKGAQFVLKRQFETVLNPS